MQSRVVLRATVASLAFAGLFGASGVAQAIPNTVTSNDPNCTAAPTTRVFSVTAETVVGCLLKGVGNVNGNLDPINLLPPGWATLDKSDDGTTGLLEGTLTGTPSLVSGLLGTFDIAPSVYVTYNRIVVAFKSGGGQDTPDWAGFELAEGTLTGSWSITGAKQALSHANLYGIRDPNVPPTGVPEPSVLLILGAGLLALAWQRRRMAA